MTPAIEVRELTKRYGADGPLANDGVSFAVASGSLTCLLGPNGAGKSTLVDQLTGRLVPTSGEIRVAGRDAVADPGVAQETCAALPQEAVPFLDLSVVAAIEVCGRMRGLDRRGARAEAEAEVERWDLGDRRDATIRRLSGGERRLVGIGCALVGDRPILILDEPTNDVDPVLRARLWSHLASLQAAGRTVLLVTHNLAEAETVATDVLVMTHGRLVLGGAIGELRALVGEGAPTVVSFAVPADDLVADLPTAWRSTVGAGAGGGSSLTVPGPDVAALVAWVAEHRPGWIPGLVVGRPSLESVYLEAVGAAT